MKFFRQQGRKDLWNLFVRALIEEKGWQFLRLRIVSFSRQVKAYHTQRKNISLACTCAYMSSLHSTCSKTKRGRETIFTLILEPQVFLIRCHTHFSEPWIGVVSAI